MGRPLQTHAGAQASMVHRVSWGRAVSVQQPAPLPANASDNAGAHPGCRTAMPACLRRVSARCLAKIRAWAVQQRRVPGLLQALSGAPGAAAAAGPSCDFLSMHDLALSPTPWSPAMSAFPVSTPVFSPASAHGSAGAETAAAPAGRAGQIDKAAKVLRPLVYSCSGCSSAAQLANQIAVRLERSGVAEMSCIAGVGGGVASLVKTACSGRPIIALDGAARWCACKAAWRAMASRRRATTSYSSTGCASASTKTLTRRSRARCWNAWCRTCRMHPWWLPAQRLQSRKATHDSCHTAPHHRRHFGRQRRSARRAPAAGDAAHAGH